MARMGVSYYEGLSHARPPDPRRPPARADLPAPAPPHRLAGAQRDPERARAGGRRPPRRANAILRRPRVGALGRRNQGRRRGGRGAVAPRADPRQPGRELARAPRAARAARTAALRVVPEDRGGGAGAPGPVGEIARSRRARSPAPGLWGGPGSGSCARRGGEAGATDRPPPGRAASVLRTRCRGVPGGASAGDQGGPLRRARFLLVRGAERGRRAEAARADRFAAMKRALLLAALLPL